MSPAKRPTYLIRVGRAHLRLVISVLIGVAVALVVPGEPMTRALVGWDLAVLIYLTAAVVMMTRCTTPAHMKRNAADQDEGAAAILILTIAAALASIAAIFVELASVEQSAPGYGRYAAFAIGTIVLSWMFIHTIFALHYAHEFYGTGARKNGLRFPEDNAPDYWDFIYFAFVIGMTFQVSDVAVTQKWVRRTVVGHGAISFFFTTAFIAMTVNIAANLIQK
jgi:uncharacterized membrane protein